MGPLEQFFNEHDWTKGTRGRDAEGQIVQSLSEDAVSFCILGGVERICGCDPAQMRPILEKLRKACPANVTLIYFNDYVAKDKNDIIQLCQKAGV